MKKKNIKETKRRQDRREMLFIQIWTIAFIIIFLILIVLCGLPSASKSYYPGKPYNYEDTKPN